MDPLTALGLASNIVQFVDFSTNLIQNASKIYSSGSGIPDELEDIVHTTLSLQAFITKLPTLSVPSSASDSDRALVALANSCQKTCAELQKLVGQIKGKNSGTRMHSLRVAWRSQRNKGKIESLERKLDRHRSQVLSQLLFLLKCVIVFLKS